jgi:hypothetical protein
MKSFLAKSLLSAALLTAAVPAFAHDGMKKELEGNVNPNVVNLCHNEKIQGTYQGMMNGRVMLTTDKGNNIQVPVASLMFNTEPEVMVSSLQMGDHITVWLPEHSTMRVIKNEGNVVTLGDYTGIYVLPQEVLSRFETEDGYWSANR